MKALNIYLPRFDKRLHPQKADPSLKAEKVGLQANSVREFFFIFFLGGSTV